MNEFLAGFIVTFGVLMIGWLAYLSAHKRTVYVYLDDNDIAIVWKTRLSTEQIYAHLPKPGSDFGDGRRVKCVMIEGWL